jgi:hypothetical protein
MIAEHEGEARRCSPGQTSLYTGSGSKSWVRRAYKRAGPMSAIVALAEQHDLLADSLERSGASAPSQGLM